MNREFKFRAWDRHNKFMCSPVTVEYMAGCMPRIDLTQSTLMQYTGLKDKNGKELYEGDILYGESDEGSPGEPRILKYHALVFWNNDVGGWMVNDGETWPLCDYDFIEIVGNEYENPDLIPQ